MALISFNHDDRSYYVVDGYWSDKDWFIKGCDDELIFGIPYIRKDITDKTLLARMRRQLRILGLYGCRVSKLYRDSRVFREMLKGGGIDYQHRLAGICNLTLNGPIPVDLNKYIDHGQVVSGDWDSENLIVYGGTHDIRKKDSRKND